MSGQNLEYAPSQDPDLRYFPRWTIDNQVFYQVDGVHKSCEGIIKDISCAGACIIGDHHIEPHQKIKVAFHLTPSVKINLNGNIQWVRSRDGRLIMGVTFHDTPDHIQELILQHAFEIDKEKVVNQWFKGWEAD